jgi:hypothetical protein
MTVSNRWRLRLALDVKWMTLAPLQADVLEWVLPRHRLSKTSGTRLSQSRLKGRVPC